MKQVLVSLLAMASLHIAAFSVTSAQAQPTRVFVAAQGTDTNPCTFALPCRSFQRAHDVLASGGEIDVLDPAGYGALNITKAISIQGHGFAGISVGFGGRAIQINATETDAVSLNGLLIEGNGIGQYGVIFTTANSLVVNNCVVRNFTAHGLVAVSNAVSATQWLGVSNSILDNNLYGILLGTNSSGPLMATVDRSQMRGNGYGFYAFGSNGTGELDAAITDSVAANNSNGVYVESSTTHSVVNVFLTRVNVSGNRNGMVATGANANFRLAQSAVTGSSMLGFNIVNGAVGSSFGDNYIRANAGNSGSLGTIAKR